jgi:hypothetical protein
LSREVGVGEGRERKRGDGEEERVGEEDGCAVAVGKVRETRAPVAFKPLRSRHFLRYSPSHRIFGHMYKALNKDKNKN